MEGLDQALGCAGFGPPGHRARHAICRIAVVRAGVLAIVLAVALVAAALPGSSSAGTIRFVAGELETGAAQRATARSLRSQGGQGRALVLVRMRGPIRRGWVEQLVAAGASVHQYLPDYAYLATVSPESLPAIDALPHVEWVGPLPSSLKLHPAVAARARPAGALDYPREQPVDVTILSVDGGVAKALAAWGLEPTSSRRSALGWHDTRVSLPPSRLAAVARLWSVFHVELQPTYRLSGERAAQAVAGNYGVGGTTPLGPGYAAMLASEGLTGGAGLIAQIQDDGLEQGDDSNLPGTAHPDLLGRIVGIGNTTADESGASVSGHGTINAGILAGNGTVGTTDADGYLLGQGTAPQAGIYSTKLFRNDGTFDLGVSTLPSLAKDAQDAGAILSNNSWGSVANGAYTVDAAEFDRLTRDADPLEPGNQPMIYFFAAGNNGGIAQTIQSPATAKNVISVGATENTDQDGIDGCGVDPTQADSLRDLKDFSSRGPTVDGRLGVTIVAPGTHIQGPASTAQGYDGATLCDPYWPDTQTDYARSSGTSYANPLAAGVGLVVYEAYQSLFAPLGHTSTPSPALIKATLSTTATDLFGGSDGVGGFINAVPSTKQGWGSVNLANLLSMKNALVTIDQTEVFTSSGESFQLQVLPADPTQPVKISLAWTDAAGTPNANPALVNDLDLVATEAGARYHGNILLGGASIAGGVPDSLNTLESIFLANPTGEPIYIEVDAANIAGDSILGDAELTDQDFALFVWNAVTDIPDGQLLIEDDVNCSDVISLTLIDTDLASAGTQDVQVAGSNGDVETVTLVEEGVSTGFFRASLGTSNELAVVEDGTLQLSDQVEITATYDDASGSSGLPSVSVDTTTADCVAPQMSVPVIADVSSYGARVNFSTSEDTFGFLDYGLSCGALLVSRSQGLSSTHAIMLDGLPPETEHFVSVTAEDAAGNVVTDDNGGACHAFTTLAVGDKYTEIFDADPKAADENDLANQSKLFTPDGSESFYTVCSGPAFSFPTDPSGGTELVLADDGFVPVTLTGPQPLLFYGVAYTEFYVGSNGYITFGSGDEEFEESLEFHFDRPRISGLFDDLSPTAGGTVTWQELIDRVVVTFAGVPEFGGTDGNSFQIELFFDGQIRITHLDVSALDGLVGLSEGLGLAPDFQESDISGYDLCSISQGFLFLTSPDPLSCGTPLAVTVGDADLGGQGTASVLVTSSSGDSETVSLTAGAPGLFHGAVQTFEGAPVVGDTVMQVVHTDILTATYEDADDGTGNPATLSVAVPVSCIANNLGFEAGTFEDWIVADIAEPFVGMRVEGQGYSPFPGFFASEPTEGAFAAVHGWDGRGPGEIRLSADLALPPNAVAVKFAYRAAWDLETFTALQDRTFRVDIEPTGGGASLQSNTLLVATAGTIVEDTGNTLGAVDVSTFSGSEVRVSFIWDVSEDSTGPAFFQLDNVEVLLAPQAFCDVAVGQPVYTDGEQIGLYALRYANQTAGSILGARLVLQLDVAGVFTANLINAGPLQLASGFDLSAGPISLFPVQPSMPRGTWAMRCAIENSSTSAVLHERISTFEVQ